VRRLLDEHASRVAFVDYRDERWHSLERCFQSYAPWRFLWTSEWEIPLGAPPGLGRRLEAARWSTDKHVIKICFQAGVDPRFLKAASGQLIEEPVDWDRPGASPGIPDLRQWNPPGQQGCLTSVGPDGTVLTLFQKYISLWRNTGTRWEKPKPVMLSW